VINAGQFLLKLRAARRQGAVATRPAGGSGMSPLTAERCSAAPPQRGELSVQWKTAGMQNVRFIDAMSEDIPDDMRKSFLEYPWIKDKFKRRYMMGCLKAFAKTTVTKKFYDLERLKYKGGLRAEVDLGFDQSKILSLAQIEELRKDRPDLAADVDFKGTPIKVMACGGPNEQWDEESGDGATGQAVRAEKPRDAEHPVSVAAQSR
jgi:hypothetical protein